MYVERKDKELVSKDRKGEREREEERKRENVETIVRRREGGAGFPASSSAFLPFKINYQNVPSFFFYLLPWLNTSTFRY